MIYFIDEDETQVRSFRTELEIRGLNVEGILDADSAFMILSNNTSIDLAIIDVMLSANPNEAQSRFSRISTDDFTLTGITLLEDLIVANETFFPSKAVLFSMASSMQTLGRIKSASELYSIPFLRKNQFATPLEFGDKIEEILSSFKE